MKIEDEIYTLEELRNMVMINGDKELVFFNHVKRLCLDKAKVKEAFHEVELVCDGDDYFAINKALEKFKKELRL